MERSVIREQRPSVNAAPDYASLHPGYVQNVIVMKAGPTAGQV
jgi:hypothetical protein